MRPPPNPLVPSKVKWRPSPPWVRETDLFTLRRSTCEFSHARTENDVFLLENSSVMILNSPHGANVSSRPSSALLSFIIIRRFFLPLSDAPLLPNCTRRSQKNIQKTYSQPKPLNSKRAFVEKLDIELGYRAPASSAAALANSMVSSLILIA